MSQLEPRFMVWSALQALVKAYSEPNDEKNRVLVPAILSELSYDSVVGQLAVIARQYWLGTYVAWDSGHCRVQDYRMRQFDRALTGIEDLVFAHPEFFGGPKVMAA